MGLGAPLAAFRRTAATRIVCGLGFGDGDDDELDDDREVGAGWRMDAGVMVGGDSGFWVWQHVEFTWCISKVYPKNRKGRSESVPERLSCMC